VTSITAIAFAFWTGCQSATPLPKLQITEFVASNNRGLIDNFGENSDWVEITNSGETRLRLDDIALSDSEQNPIKWSFPYIVLEPGERLVVHASGRNLRDPSQTLHTNFRISAKGESLLLSNIEGVIIDNTPPVKLWPDISWGRSGEMEGYFLEPTPGGAEKSAPLEKPQAVKPGQVMISEVMSGPSSGFMDDDGDASDWIEIYNASEIGIDLTGFHMSDELRQPFKWRFPQIEIPPKEHITVFASGKDREGGGLHTSFRVRSDESVALFSPSGVLLDMVPSHRMKPGHSFGRIDGEWIHFSLPTPGKGNSTAPMAKGHLQINETMAESYGTETDWIELFNASEEAMQLEGYGLSDDSAAPFRWTFPAYEIPAGEYLRIEPTGCLEQCRPFEASFRLGPEGEDLVLTSPEGYILDRYSTGVLREGISSGRDPKNPEQRLFYSIPTPGKRNKGPSFIGYSKNPVPDFEPGYHPSGLVAGFQKAEGSIIRYTLDGSLPNRKSKRYESPIPLEGSTVIRARAYSKGRLPSPTVTQTVLLREPHAFPVVSIAASPAKMFNEEWGMYSMGPNAEEDYPNFGANFWKEIELASNFEIFNQEGKPTYAAEAGLSIFGGFSRSLPKKSFKLTARSEYGQSIFHYPFFPNRSATSYNSFVLRASGQDSQYTGFKDVLVNWLCQDMDLDKQDYRVATVYINGDYWGVYHFREKINEEFFSHRSGQPEDAVSYLTGNIKWGNLFRKEILYPLAAMDSEDPKSMEWLEERVDVSSFTDWMLAQIFINNRDVGNVRYWRTDAENSRWRWVLYDTDMALGSTAEDTIERLLDPEKGNLPDFQELFNWLYSAPGYRERFLTRASHLYTDVFTTARLEEGIELFKSRYSDEMKEDRPRWGVTHRRWNGYIRKMNWFATYRPNILRRDFEEHFDLSAEELQQYFPLREG
jgi:hypothetical protein